jgi:hypothetical protein
MTSEVHMKKRSLSVKMSASQSFSEAEVVLLDALCLALRSGKDVRQLLKSQAANNVFRKVFAMKSRIETLRAGRDGTTSAILVAGSADGKEHNAPDSHT